MKFEKNDNFWTLEKKKILAEEFNARARLLNSKIILTELDFEISDEPSNQIFEKLELDMIIKRIKNLGGKYGKTPYNNTLDRQTCYRWVHRQCWDVITN